MKKLGQPTIFLLGVSLGVVGQAQADTCVLSFDRLEVPSGERVVGFDIKVKPAYISSMTSAPLGWRIHIDNQPSWNAEVTGDVTVGAAAL
jgi:hypothetical protein